MDEELGKHLLLRTILFLWYLRQEYTSKGKIVTLENLIIFPKKSLYLSLKNFLKEFLLLNFISSSTVKTTEDWLPFLSSLEEVQGDQLEKIFLEPYRYEESHVQY